LSPWTIEEAYGLCPYSGVAPLALVHMNRLPQPQATILGIFYDYAAEPMSGLARPCPPGPGLPAPWGDFKEPWVVVHVSSLWHGSEQLKRYEEHARKKTREEVPGNEWARNLAWDVQEELFSRAGHRLGTGESSEYGKLLMLFAHRSNVNKIRPRSAGRRP